ncbi:MAG: hypothetical protein QOI65_2091 [Thermoleophilaceae bacterium]|jgi:predicted Rossmann fold nucleotide-binding protein DprA/Smf involved in DNA uptake|nr:hypothetical protein [Thermoleophilaceae bacterium]
MSAAESNESVVGRVETELVEACLRKIGGGVRVAEIAYKTGLTLTEVMDALCQLEEQGRAEPQAWTLGPNSAPYEPRP